MKSTQIAQWGALKIIIREKIIHTNMTIADRLTSQPTLLAYESNIYTYIYIGCEMKAVIFGCICNQTPKIKSLANSFFSIFFPSMLH